MSRSEAQVPSTWQMLHLKLVLESLETLTPLWLVSFSIVMHGRKKEEEKKKGLHSKLLIIPSLKQWSLLRPWKGCPTAKGKPEPLSLFWQAAEEGCS